MTPLPFLDTNIILRHLLQDVPSQSPQASAYIQRIAAGTQRVRIADTVIFETVFTLQRGYRVPKGDIAAACSRSSSCAVSCSQESVDSASRSTISLISISPSGMLITRH